jgi:dolichol-phosphate mannosyltransferase
VRERDTLIVIPTYNERENLRELLGGIRQHAPDVSVLFVDDGSPDGTSEEAEALGRDFGAVEVLQRGQRLGIGSAYRDGFARGLAAGYRRLISMDADLSHQACYVPELLAACERADVVVGSRYLRGVSVVNWSLKRLVLSIVANRYARAITGLPVRDCTSGFQCFRREVLEAIDIERLRLDGYAFLVEIKYKAHRLGFRLGEIPIVFIDRRAGSSKLGLSNIVQSSWAVWALRLGLV